MQIDFALRADGQDITDLVQDRLVSLRLVDEAGLSSDRLEITLDDRDGRLDVPPMEAVLEVALGFKETGLTEMGRFVVDDIRGDGPPDRMTLRATAADMTGAIRSPRSLAWEGLTLGEITETIARRHNLRPAIAADLASLAIPYRAQTAESDLHFLTRLAREFDLIAKPAGGALIVARSGTGLTAEGTPMPTIPLTRPDLTSWDWQMTGRQAYASVRALWRDVDQGQTRELVAGSGAPERVLRHPFASQAEARAAAQAALSARTRATLSLELAGFWGELAAEAQIELAGLRTEIDGIWRITSVEHVLAKSLTTSVQAERAPDS